MIKKFKKYSLQTGMFFTAVVALFGVVFTWVVFEHEPTYLRMQDDLYDCGIDAFVGNAEQFDDLTMLCLEYRGLKEKETEEN